jgi:hypothetical protein
LPLHAETREIVFAGGGAMNSMAQHAVPNGMGQREFFRPQLMKASSLVVIQGSSP